VVYMMYRVITVSDNLCEKFEGFYLRWRSLRPATREIPLFEHVTCVEHKPYAENILQMYHDGICSLICAHGRL